MCGFRRAELGFFNITNHEIHFGNLRCASSIIQRYIATDPEVQEVVAYLQGDEWAALVADVAQNPTWIEFKEYLLSEGIDLDAIIQYIHDLIGGLRSARMPTHKRTARSLRDMVDEIIAIIPVNDLLNVLNDKLQNSADFQRLFEVLSSDEARGLVEEVLALPEAQRIAQELRDLGINVDVALEFIFGILGWAK
ncbi:Insect allergen related repeat, nitrile-specifier detoxification [Popillia japonica]|uniref:Insect allergen related repeat, nitrile-specifier detoxification n=1 Tax=Popillia japonica TaxID=7064 RepID=A0AAW1HT45_POPJA